MTQDKKIQSALDDMHKAFMQSDPNQTRKSYAAAHGLPVTGDWIWALSADKILNGDDGRPLNPSVGGCDGVAKVFCKFAQEQGLDCHVLVTVSTADLAANKQHLSGHQIIAVKKGKKWHAFEPGKHRKLKYIDSPIEIGQVIDFEMDDEIVPHKITAIISTDDYANISTYKDLHNLYTHPQPITDKTKQFTKGTQKLNFWRALRRRLMREND